MKKYNIINIKKIVFFTTLFASLLSCSDLEEDPEGILVSPETFFKTTENLESAVNAAYSFVASEELWGRRLTLSLLLRGDMVTIGDQTTSARRIEVDQFRMTSGNEMVSSIWPRSFNIITSANNALSAIDLVDASQTEKERIEGQARFIRAFAYYHLVRVFGEVPFLDSVPTSANDILGISKSSVPEIYAKIIEDLKIAKELLPQNVDFRSRPSSGTASAYLASVYLTQGEWQLAYDEATSIINNKGSFGYDLEADFQNLFDATKQDAPEKIFSIEFKGNDVVTGNIGQDFLAPVTGLRGFPDQEGWSVAVPSLRVFDSFEEGDYRRDVSFITSYEISEPNDEGVPVSVTIPWQDFGRANRAVSRPHIAKYFRFPGNAGRNNRDSDHNYIAMRYAEVLLIAAEASNELFGPTAEAEGYINEIRTRARNAAGVQNAIPANISITGISQALFKEMILEERRIELAFEFKRWYDLLRLNIAQDSFGPDGFDPQSNFDINRDLLYPLPGDELDRIPSLLPQNPGY